MKTKNKPMVTPMTEILEMSALKRCNLLSSTVSSARKAQKTVAKILVAASEKGDYAEGEMNAYSLKHTGVELRRELQGTYEHVNVLKAMRSNAIDFKEEEFDVIPSFAAIILSSLLAKSPEKVAAALEIIRSGVDVTKRLQALNKGDKPAKGGDGEGAGEGGEGDAPPEIQTPDNADTFVIPHDVYVMNHDPILQRIVDEIDTAEPEDLAVLATIFERLAARVAKAAKSTQLAAA
jgi:hypothetical protein